MEDEFYPKAVMAAKAAIPLSVAHLQRMLLIGYNRASRLMDRMIVEGIVETFEREHGVGYRLVSKDGLRAER